MIKQRRESITMYEQGGRQELADAEKAEVAVIEDFLPQQMSEAEANAAIDQIIAETGASSIKDMGKVMAALKERHAGEIDMAKASGMVKARMGQTHLPLAGGGRGGACDQQKPLHRQGPPPPPSPLPRP